MCFPRSLFTTMTNAATLTASCDDADDDILPEHPPDDPEVRAAADAAVHTILRSSLRLPARSSALYLLYDAHSPPARALARAYARAPARGLVASARAACVPTWETRCPPGLAAAALQQDVFAHVRPDDAVVLVQSDAFRLDSYRFRLRLFERGVKTAEHAHLALNRPHAYVPLNADNGALALRSPRTAVAAAAAEPHAQSADPQSTATQSADALPLPAQRSEQCAETRAQTLAYLRACAVPPVALAVEAAQLKRALDRGARVVVRSISGRGGDGDGDGGGQEHGEGLLVYEAPEASASASAHGSSSNGRNNDVNSGFVLMRDIAASAGAAATASAATRSGSISASITDGEVVAAGQSSLALEESLINTGYYPLTLPSWYLDDVEASFYPDSSTATAAARAPSASARAPSPAPVVATASHVGGGYPVGEVFSEARALPCVSGLVYINGFPCLDRIVRSCAPFPLRIAAGRVTAVSARAPAAFLDVLRAVFRDEGGELWVRELGLGLNGEMAFAPAERRVNGLLAFERMRGVHLSIGKKHTVYSKGDMSRKHAQARYHIDVFVAATAVEVDGVVRATFEPSLTGEL